MKKLLHIYCIGRSLDHKGFVKPYHYNYCSTPSRIHSYTQVAWQQQSDSGKTTLHYLLPSTINMSGITIELFPSKIHKLKHETYGIINPQRLLLYIKTKGGRGLQLLLPLLSPININLK